MGVKDTSKLGEIVDAMADIITKAEEQIKDKTQNLTLMNYKHEELKEKIEQTTRKAIKRIEVMRDEAVENLESCHSEETKCVETQRDVLQRSKMAMDLDLKYVEAITRHGSSKQLFITLEKIRQQVNHHQQVIAADSQRQDDIDYQFHFNEHFETVARRLTSMGKLEVLRANCFKKTENNEKKSVKINLNRNQVVTRTNTAPAAVHSRAIEVSWETVDAFNIKMKKEKDYDGSMPGDRKCAWFTGGTFCLDDTQLILADYNNHKLKRFKKDFCNPIMEYAADSAPCDIALIKEDEIVVTFPHVCRLSRYKLTNGGPLKQMDAITMPSAPEGVACSGSSIIVAFSDCIKVIDENGREAVTIPTQESFTYTTPVVAMRHSEGFVHRDGDTIVCRTMDGSEIFRSVLIANIQRGIIDLSDLL